MAISLSFPKYSFVQAGPLTASDAASADMSCYPDPSFCLPMSSAAYLQFYAYLTGVDTSADSGVTNVLTYAYVVPVDYWEPTQTELNSFVSANNPLLFGNHYSPGLPAVTDTMEVHFDVSYGPNISSRVSVGSCFKLMLVCRPCIASGGYVDSFFSPLFAGFTNCFQCISIDSCYASVLVYSNNSDAFGFQAMDGHDNGLPAGVTLPSIDPPDNSIRLPNIVELPMYLRDPKMENDQKVYTRSDGSLVKLYERKEEVYILETDLMPYIWHKSLDIALSHDNVFIICTNTTSFDPLNTAISFVKKENYEIEYNKAPLSALGKGSCKLSNANPIHLINNNCG